MLFSRFIVSAVTSAFFQFYAIQCFGFCSFAFFLPVSYFCDKENYDLLLDALKHTLFVHTFLPANETKSKWNLNNNNNNSKKCARAKVIRQFTGGRKSLAVFSCMPLQ